MKKKRTEEEMKNFDITGNLASMFTTPKYPDAIKGIDQWEMYSYERPAYMLWNAIGKQLYKDGWELDEIRVWLQSKHTRWDLDDSLGTAIQLLGQSFARKLSKNKDLHEEIEKWVKEGA